jgi:hypothetical protein
LIRARTGEGRARAVARGQKMGRPFKLTDHQKREAIKRRNQGETLADIRPQLQCQPGHDFSARRLRTVENGFEFLDSQFCGDLLDILKHGWSHWVFPAPNTL